MSLHVFRVVLHHFAFQFGFDPLFVHVLEVFFAHTFTHVGVSRGKLHTFVQVFLAVRWKAFVIADFVFGLNIRVETDVLV